MPRFAAKGVGLSGEGRAGMAEVRAGSRSCPPACRGGCFSKGGEYCWETEEPLLLYGALGWLVQVLAGMNLPSQQLECICFPGVRADLAAEPS